MALYNRKGGLSNFPADYLVIESFWITTLITRNEFGIQENRLIKNKAKFMSFSFSNIYEISEINKLNQRKVDF